MRQFTRLGDDPLTSRDGRHVLRYEGGVATLTDTATRQIRWHADGFGTLLLGRDGVLLTEDEDHHPLWTSPLRHPDAHRVVITDEGDLELLDGDGVRLVNSRTGAVEVTVLRDAAPAAAITDSAHLAGRNQRIVTRNRDGSLQVSEQTWSHTLDPWLSRWLAQDGTVLTWRQVPEKRGKTSRLVLVDADGELLWRDTNRDAPCDLPPAIPHAYGGPELPAGGRLRHQSLTSPNGSHTLVHQEDGNLVLYCNSRHQAVWASNTWWGGNGWADLTDGDLVVRTMYGAPLWRAGTTTATKLVVNDDGTMALAGTDWVFDGHRHCTEPGMNTARGNTMARGQTLQRQSLTADDGVTVFAHRDDRRLVQLSADGTWMWDEYVWDAERSYLKLGEDGMLRLHHTDGSPISDIAGPADVLTVTPEGVELHRDGNAFWRNGKAIEPEGWDDWMSALMDDTAYCATVIHDVEPAEALRRLLGEDVEIHEGSWNDLRTLADEQDLDWEDTAVAAFPIGRHTLLVEDNGWAARERPDLSAGTFAVTCYMSVNADTSFLVFRDGAVVADHTWDNGSAEPTTPEVLAALDAMGADDVIEAAYEHDLELLCRTAGVRVTVADVTGTCRYAVGAAE
ncbi:hypothetical protein JJ691_29280 [Kutzneria sp. CA-103260]|nr:hypothetical protein JJ691_29280 [Kutzneria sp. CA-103260]